MEKDDEYEDPSLNIRGRILFAGDIFLDCDVAVSADEAANIRRESKVFSTARYDGVLFSPGGAANVTEQCAAYIEKLMEPEAESRDFDIVHRLLTPVLTTDHELMDVLHPLVSRTVNVSTQYLDTLDFVGNSLFDPAEMYSTKIRFFIPGGPLKFATTIRIPSEVLEQLQNPELFTATVEAASTLSEIAEQNQLQYGSEHYGSDPRHALQEDGLFNPALWGLDSSFNVLVLSLAEKTWGHSGRMALAMNICSRMSTDPHIANLFPLVDILLIDGRFPEFPMAVFTKRGSAAEKGKTVKSYYPGHWIIRTMTDREFVSEITDLDENVGLKAGQIQLVGTHRDCMTEAVGEVLMQQITNWFEYYCCDELILILRMEGKTLLMKRENDEIEAMLLFYDVEDLPGPIFGAGDMFVAVLAAELAIARETTEDPSKVFAAVQRANQIASLNIEQLHIKMFITEIEDYKEEGEDAQSDDEEVSDDEESEGDD